MTFQEISRLEGYETVARTDKYTVRCFEVFFSMLHSQANIHRFLHRPNSPRFLNHHKFLLHVFLGFIRHPIHRGPDSTDFNGHKLVQHEVGSKGYGVRRKVQNCKTAQK